MNSQKPTDELPPVPDVLERLPEDLQEIYIEAVAFRGPIPPPSILAAYEKVIPRGADRLLTLAEREQQHRFELVKRAQLFGLISSLATTAGAVVIAIYGSPVVAGLLGSAGLLAGIASVLASIFGRDGD